MTIISKLRSSYRILALISGLFGTITILIRGSISGGYFYILTYFTVLSNILVCIFLTTELIHQIHGRYSITENSFFHPAVHGAVTLYILITGIIFNTLLGPWIDSSGFDLFNMHITHTITPLLFIGDYLLNRQRRLIKWRHLKLWLIFPVVYLIESSIEGYFTKQFRYPFLDYLNQPLSMYIIVLLIVTSAFILMGAMLIYIDRRTIHA